MLRVTACLVVAGILLLGAGCKGFDDSQEQSEYEKLRTYPAAPQGDRVLPEFEKKRDSEDSSPFAARFYPRDAGAAARPSRG